MFGVDVQHTADLQAAFVSNGIEAYHVHGSTKKAERAEILADFRAQRFPVLINCGVYTEGTDIPCVDCLILARPVENQETPSYLPRIVLKGHTLALDSIPSVMTT